MNPKLTKAILLVVLLASPWLFVQGWIFVAAQDEPISSMETCSETSANCAHLGGGMDYRMESLPTILERSMEDVRSDLSAYVTDCNCDVLDEDETDSTYFLHFVEHTSFWLFPDDVLISIEIAGQNTVKIELHSESRLGLGDLGVNPERLERIHDHLDP